MEVHRVGRRYSFPLHVRPAYRRLRRDRSFDVVVENVNKLPLFSPLWVEEPQVVLVNHLFGATAFREASLPVALTVWGSEKLLPAVYGGQPFHAVSESTARDLERRGIPGHRIDVVYGGVDHDRYRPDPGGSRYPAPTFVSVGRLKRYKGLGVVLRALARLAGRGVKYRWRVAGTGDDLQRLERLARDLGVAGQVEFLGYVSEGKKVEVYRRGWANLYPSPKEGWGLTNLEAAACGTPTIASDSPGLRESVRDEETGFLVPHDDPGAWAERMQVVARDREVREELARGALRFAEAFTWDRAARETEALLKAVP